MKLFKKPAFKVFYAGTDGSMKVIKIYDKSEVENNQVTVHLSDTESKTINFETKNVMYHKGIPCIIAGGDQSKALNRDNLSKTSGVTASQLNSAIENNIIKDLLKVGKEDNTIKIIFAGVMASIAGILFIGYLVYDMSEVLNQVIEIVRDLETITNNEFVRN